MGVRSKSAAAGRSCYAVVSLYDIFLHLPISNLGLIHQCFGAHIVCLLLLLGENLDKKSV